ncbi:MAG: ornithine carbamoyltransferase, ornithine carbamoyltransferase [Candidatus Gottesmanbacteria bacterium GW2011_GWA2_43_14]|uniref:Ornithine carbamoyltransferase n=1 Tax=Candidatus Gottesmanbacteria bacterium GW2011_GWA2_43_14 TaxID=1618443 RepID=A0A0G1GFP0_9BACT|nr:MAG: ornithine carbamoyltransferase, ornithine carbamoyltransferase [Candidatus Gottesmanbacteria bacterium GW2011_GWA2_43_14]
MTKLKHFLSITDFTGSELLDIFTLAKTMKEEFKKIGASKPLLNNKTLVMIFEKQSLRTRVSFETAMTQLGGHAVNLSQNEIGIGKRESIPDMAGVISGIGDLLMARTYKHNTLEQLADYSIVPLINGLSDLEHPCQALADFLTIFEEKGTFSGLTLAYVGDGENNIAHSLCLGCALLGINFRCASPPGYSMKPEIVANAMMLAGQSKSEILQTSDPKLAVKNADVVYTDTWVSMGDEKEEAVRLVAFQPYQVSKKIMGMAKYNAIFMHDMPVKRGQEVTEEVIDGPQSVIFTQAHNRLHVQKALLVKLLEGNLF